MNKNKNLIAPEKITNSVDEVSYTHPDHASNLDDSDSTHSTEGQEVPVLMAGKDINRILSSEITIGEETTNMKIKVVVFQRGIGMLPISEDELAIDLSLNQDNMIFGVYSKKECKLYIRSNKDFVLNEDSSYMFYDMPHLEAVNMSSVNLTEDTCIKNIFKNSTELKTVSIGSGCDRIENNKCAIFGAKNVVMDVDSDTGVMEIESISRNVGMLASIISNISNIKKK